MSNVIVILPGVEDNENVGREVENEGIVKNINSVSTKPIYG